MKPDKVLSMLGIAKKAGCLKAGTFQVEEAVKSQMAYLVIGAVDGSDRRKKDIENMCQYYETPYFFYGTKEELGKCIGKEFSALVAITDENLATSIIEKVDIKAYR
ncbi:MAG: ribosomal L7Ae/L30e/S12e/Gadd45 family protein [Lachnospiraceae bacterium]|nr:ribosomal L7Ae/L30e/S12e/Gadd45 family protein [Lachnospiraceae bacterium]